MSDLDFSEHFQEKSLNNKFRFKCVVGCDLCCRDNDIALYPFDIMQLCNHFNLPAGEFHARHTRFVFDSEAALLRCYLRTEGRCHFFDAKESCTVYEARPVRCRLFPAARQWNPDSTVQYFLPRMKCQGFEHGHKQTIQEWFSQPEIKEFEKLAIDWQGFINEVKNNESIDRGDRFFITMFKKIFYDLDDSLMKIAKQQGTTSEKSDYQARMAELYTLARVFLYHIEDWKRAQEEIAKQG